MKNSVPNLNAIEKACFQVFAHAISRLSRRDMTSELRRLEGLGSTRRYFELTAFFGILFALSILSASLGWMVFGVFFLIVLIVFY